MKKGLIVALVLGGLIGLGVVIVGVRGGWFSSPAPTPVSEPPQEDPKRKPEDVVAVEGKARVESLEKASEADMAKALDMWKAQKGIERKISWEAVRVGAGADHSRDVRLRACRLAQALASGRPDGVPVAPPADPRAVDPLFSCLTSKDPGLVNKAVLALGTVHLNNPTLGVKPRLLTEAGTLLGSDDPKLSLAVTDAVPVLGEVAMAPKLIDAWKRHAKAEGFEKVCVGHLRVLVKLQLTAELQKAHADWPKSKCASEARTKAEGLYAELGSDPEKWRGWFEKALAGG